MADDTVSHPFAARYSSKCGGCGERIHEGDTVVYGGTSVIHVDCADTVADERPDTICPTCHLATPCGCEDD